MKKAKSFSEKVREVVRKIPRGKTLTYAQVAMRAGSPGAARAVGGVVRKNFDPSIPCHRVIRSDGSFGGYNRGGPSAKRQILEMESLHKKANARRRPPSLKK
jgi:O-6-methylguanine DNA methyltransferase